MLITDNRLVVVKSKRPACLCKLITRLAGFVLQHTCVIPTDRRTTSLFTESCVGRFEELEKVFGDCGPVIQIPVSLRSPERTTASDRPVTDPMASKTRTLQVFVGMDHDQDAMLSADPDTAGDCFLCCS